MLYLPATSPSSSTLTLRTLTRPAYSLASASTCGAIILQGPHQTAQKSTRTGRFDFSTCSSNSEVVTAVALLIVFNLQMCFARNVGTDNLCSVFATNCL